MKNLKKKLVKLYKLLRSKSDIIFLFLILIVGFFLRYYLISQKNIVFDYDQFEDLFHTKKILFGDFPIIGRAIYGNPNLHHGVLYFYYNLIPFILFKQNPIYIALWNSLFNISVAALLFYFSKSLFRNNRIGLISSFLWAFSSQIIDFSAWISSTTLTLFTVPLFFYGLWSFYKKKNWGIVLSAIMLGFSIQLELFFLYLIPLILLFWVVFRPKFPNLKLLLFSILGFLVSVFTLILTEIKLNFSGIKALLNFSSTFGDDPIPLVDRITYYFRYLSNTFLENIFPVTTKYGIYLFIGVFIISLTVFFNKKEKLYIKNAIKFVYLYLFSSTIMLLWGFHRQPWFFIGINAAIVLLSSYVIYKFKNIFLISCILLLLGTANIIKVVTIAQNGTEMFKSENTSFLASQLSVVEYIYEEAAGKSFALNSVSYPLYHNALWEYHFDWYGYRKFGYYPGWLGGEQLYPYKTIPVATGNETIIFFIIDNTNRIPESYQKKGFELAKKYGKVIDEKDIRGFTVIKVVR